MGRQLETAALFDVGLSHEVVDGSALFRRNVRGGSLALVYKLFE